MVNPRSPSYPHPPSPGTALSSARGVMAIALLIGATLSSPPFFPRSSSLGGTLNTCYVVLLLSLIVVILSQLTHLASSTILYNIPIHYENNREQRLGRKRQYHDDPNVRRSWFQVMLIISSYNITYQLGQVIKAHLSVAPEDRGFRPLWWSIFAFSAAVLTFLVWVISWTIFYTLWNYAFTKFEEAFLSLIFALNQAAQWQEDGVELRSKLKAKNETLRKLRHEIYNLELKRISMQQEINMLIEAANNRQYSGEAPSDNGEGSENSFTYASATDRGGYEADDFEYRQADVDIAGAGGNAHDPMVVDVLKLANVRVRGRARFNFKWPGS